MSIFAILPIENVAAANAALEAQGFGPGNFYIPAYGSSGPTHGATHCWDSDAFAAAVKALPGVVWDESNTEPLTGIDTLIAAQGAQWGANAPLLPTEGNAIAGTLYAFERDGVRELWYCIQTFNRSTFGAPPETYPALIRRQRIPGEVLPWVQPIDQFDSYKLVNPFTGKADTALHGGRTWRTKVDNNVWEPTAQSLQWEEIDASGNVVVPPAPPVEEYPAWVQPTGGHNAYKIGDKVTFEGNRYTSKINGNVWSPTGYPAGWQLVGPSA